MKKIATLILVSIFLVTLMIVNISAFDFDNVLTYEKEDMKVTINNCNFWLLTCLSDGELIGSAELKSHKTVDEVLKFGFGREEVVMYYDFENWDLYKEGLGEVIFIDKRTGKEIEKDYYFVELKEVEVPNRITVCEDVKDLNGTIYNECRIVQDGTKLQDGWVEYNSKDIPNRNTRIGIMTYINQGDYLDAIWTIAGKKVTKHAEWTAELNVGLIAYYTFDEGSGDAIDSTGNQDGEVGADVTRSVAGIQGTAYNFSGDMGGFVNVTGLTSTTQNLSVSFWALPIKTGVGVDYTMFDYTEGRIFLNLPASQVLTGTIQYNDGTARDFGETIIFDVYQHYVLVLDEVEDKGYLYIDGVLDGTEPDYTQKNIGGNFVLGGQFATGRFRGSVDEFAIWDRPITQTEVTTLYNGGAGITWTDFFPSDPSVTLGNPANTTNLTVTSQDFTATIFDETNITNATFILNDEFNVTNSTAGVNNSIYTFSVVGLAEGNHTWTMEACDFENTCANATQRTFQVDSLNPAIIILAPSETVEIQAVNLNLSFNWSANDTNLDACVFQYAGSNTTVTCSDNTTNINITSSINRSIIFYVNDTFGNLNSSSISWNYTIFENSQTFNEEVFEGNTEQLTANVTISGSSPISIASLFYNGTATVGTFSQSGNDTITSIDFLIPIVDGDSNVTFIWNLQLSDGQSINITPHNQTITSLSLDDCSVNTITLYNFTMVDEANQSELTNTTMEINLNLLDVERVNYIANFTNISSEINPFPICINTDFGSSTYSVDVIVKYEASAYSIEYYNIVNATILNSTIPINITLYDLALLDATEFKISFKGEDFVFVEDALIFIDRQYISENNSFKTVELPKTDSGGKTVGHFVRNDVIYNIRVIKNGVLLGSFSNINAFCTDFTIGDCQIVLEATPTIVGEFSYDEEVGILFESVPTYDDTTNAVTFSFLTDDGSTKSVLMEVTRSDVFGNRSICNSTVTSSSGTLSCSVDPNIDDTSLRTSIFVDDELAVLSTIKLESSNYGNTGYVLWFLITFFFIWIFGNSKTEVLMGLGISTIGAIALGITEGTIVGIGSAGIWILVIVILGIYKLNKDNPQ